MFTWFQGNLKFCPTQEYDKENNNHNNLSPEKVNIWRLLKLFMIKYTQNGKAKQAECVYKEADTSIHFHRA